MWSCGSGEDDAKPSFTIAGYCAVGEVIEEGTNDSSLKSYRYFDAG